MLEEIAAKIASGSHVKYLGMKASERKEPSIDQVINADELSP